MSRAGVPGGSLVRSPPASTGDVCSIPGPGEPPDAAAEQLSSGARVLRPCSATREAAAVRSRAQLERSSQAPQLGEEVQDSESPSAAKRYK